MGRHDRFWLGFFMGTTLLLGVASLGGLALPASHANNPAVASGDVVALVGNQQQGQETLFLIDAKERRLAVYAVKGGALDLTAARNFAFDLKLDELGKQSPTVTEVFEKTKAKKP